MSPKVAVVIVVAVVLLFVAAGVTSGRRGEGELPRPPDTEDDRGAGFPAGLSRRLGASAAVDRDDMTIECIDPDDRRQLRFTGSCEIRVDGSGERMRLLRMETASAVHVVAPAPEPDRDGDRYEIEADFEPGKRITLAIGRDRTVVALECGLGETCVVRLLDD